MQNAAAKVITGNKKHDHVTPILYDLHWLPIEQRIVFKLLLTCYKALNDVGPLYIKDLLPLAKDKGKGLRSSKDPLLLEDPRHIARPMETGLLVRQDLGRGTICHLVLDNLPLSILLSLLSRHVCSRLPINASDTYVFLCLSSVFMNCDILLTYFQY